MFFRRVQKEKANFFHLASAASKRCALAHQKNLHPFEFFIFQSAYDFSESLNHDEVVR